MSDQDAVPPGHLEVGISEDGEYVFVKTPTSHGFSRVVFSPEQAREFSRCLLACADECELAKLPRC
jgi:hypothetical protein